MKFDLVEHPVRFERVARAGDHELLRRLDLLVAEDVAAQVQAHLAPVSDRQHRALDFVEPPVGRARAPEFVVERVLDDGADEIEFHRRPAVLAGQAVLVVGAQRRVPDRAVAAVDAAVVVRSAILVDEAVVGRDAGEPRRVVGRHQPLRHRVVRLADAADAAVAPALLDDPGDHFEIVLLLVETHEFEFAFGTARAAHVGVDIGVALADVPFDRAGLAPQEQRIGWHIIHLVLVGRGRKQRRETACGVRPVDAKRDADPVAHGDGDALFDLHRWSPCPPRFPIARH